MTTPYPTPPSNLRSLRDRLTHVSRREGLSFGRLQQHVGVLVVTQFMSDLTDDSGYPQLLVKGGSALELRRGIAQSRASKDLDAVTSHDIYIVHELLAAKARIGWEGFTAVLTEPEPIMVPGLVLKPQRFIAKVNYQGRPFVSVPIEVSPVEAGNTEGVDWAHSPAFALVGLPDPRPIPCMTLDWQIAQKLHAVTAVLPGERRNDRAHDLVDLQILEALIGDRPLSAVRTACVTVFEVRDEQAWPPSITIPPHWPVVYAKALESVSRLGLAGDVYGAAERVGALIERIQAS
jgi:hypothetical protein